MVQLYMARDIAHFVNFPVYFYGQQYMGPLESYVMAPLVRLFGFSWIKGRIYYEIFYLSFMGLYLWTVRRLFNHETTLYLFILLCVLPFTALFFTVIVGYSEILALAALCLATLVKIASDTKSQKALTLLLGAVSGLAFWCNSLFIVWLIPIGVILFTVIPSSWKRGLPLWFSIGFLAGLFPVWIHGIRTGTFLVVQGAGYRFAALRDTPQILFLFFSRLRFFLSTYSFGWDFPILTQVIIMTSFLPLVLFGVSFCALLFSVLKNFHNRTPAQKSFYLFMILPCWMLGLFYVFRDMRADEGMRYFLPLLFPYAFSIAWWTQTIRQESWKKIILVTLAGVLLLGSAESLKMQRRDTVEIYQILNFLRKNGLNYGVTLSEPAYALNALGHEEILATPILYNARYGPAWEMVKKQGPSFYILERSDPFYRKEAETDPNLKKISFPRYDLFYGRSPLLLEILEAKNPVHNL